MLVFRRSNASPLVVALIFFGLTSCADLSSDQPNDVDGIPMEETYLAPSSPPVKLKVLTFNMSGPDLKSKKKTKKRIRSLRYNYLNGEHILLLQEAKHPGEIEKLLEDEYPYYCRVKYSNTKVGTFSSYKHQWNMIFSKLPIVDKGEKYIQRDPNGSKWERYAHYATVKLDNSTPLTIFNFHNTYNNSDSTYEMRGMRRFKWWIQNVMGTDIASSSQNLIFGGDFNISSSRTNSIVGNGHTRASGSIDHIYSPNLTRSRSGILPTNSGSNIISDHPAVWIEYNETYNAASALNYLVRVYEKTNFSGECASFEIGEYPDIDGGCWKGWDNEISSVRVGSKVKLEGYVLDNYESATHGPRYGKVYYWPQVNNSGTLHSLGLNNWLSSLKVKAR